jgi:hypothetical protein
MDITIEFQDEHRVKRNTTYRNFSIGQIKNPYDRATWNIGYPAEGKYSVMVDGKRPLYYSCWRDMLRRCYDGRYKEMYPEYSDCYTCDEWHCLQTFGKWFEDNYYSIENERVQLDKDIVFKGNRMYSPETCIFVPQSINLVFQRKSRKEDLPTGIIKRKNGFNASYNNKNLGTYSLIQEALEVYNAEKKRHIVELANQYIGRIPDKVYDILMNYET